MRVVSIPGADERLLCVAAKRSAISIFFTLSLDFSHRNHSSGATVSRNDIIDVKLPESMSVSSISVSAISSSLGVP